MAMKSESVHPPKPQESTTPTLGVTGRTPEVPDVDQIPMQVTLRPVDGQPQCAAEVARELLASATYASDFGKHAPVAATAASLLQQARVLGDETARAEAWLAHLTAQRDRAWHQALAVMSELKPAFDVADASDPNIATRYAATRAFFGARSVIAVRAQVTRRRNRAAKNNTPA